MPERSQDSSVSVVTGVGARRRGIVAPFPAGQDIFIFPQTSGKRLGTTESPVQWVPGLRTRGGNWPGGEADHFSLSCVQVKNERSSASTPPCAFMLCTGTMLHFAWTCGSFAVWSCNKQIFAPSLEPLHLLSWCYYVYSCCVFRRPCLREGTAVTSWLCERDGRSHWLFCGRQSTSQHQLALWGRKTCGSDTSNQRTSS